MAKSLSEKLSRKKAKSRARLKRLHAKSEHIKKKRNNRWIQGEQKGRGGNVVETPSTPRQARNCKPTPITV